MYKLLIVDDEELVRKAIITKLDWTNIGFDTVLEAEDGEEALSISLEQKPDVVLTDIRMPFMDGLELAEKLGKVLPGTKVIILSGHDEFEYAQEAIKIGVLDYILKPIRSAKLTELMERIKKLLDDEKKENEKLQKIRNQLHQSLPLLKERFLNSLINNSVKDTEIRKKLDYLDIKIPGDSFTVCVCEIDNLNVLADEKSAADMDLLIFSVLNIVAELSETKGTAFNDFYNRQVIVFSGENPGSMKAENDLYSILEGIRENVEKYLKVTVSIGIGSTVRKLKDVSISYKDALYALDYKMFMGKNRVYDIKDLGYRQSNIYYPIDKINAVLSTVKQESVEEVKKHVDLFFNDLISKKSLSPDNIKIILSELVNSAQRLLMEIKNEEEGSFNMDFGIYEKISRHDTLEDIKLVISKFLTDICKYIRTVRNNRNLNIIDKAKSCINEYYHLEDLSLNYVADTVSISPGYLSILFRRETDETFIEYLTRVRMEKAKELLRTSSMKAYEVAYKVGYSDPHYFSICFKKYTGCTPSDYKGNN